MRAMSPSYAVLMFNCIWALLEVAGGPGNKIEIIASKHVRNKDFKCLKIILLEM